MYFGTQRDILHIHSISKCKLCHMQCIFKDKNILVLHMKIRVSFTREGVMLRMKFLD